MKLIIISIILLVSLYHVTCVFDNDAHNVKANNDFVEHLLRSTKQFIKHHSIEVKPWTKVGKNEKGVFTTQDIEQGTDIFSLPWVNVFSTDRVKKEVPLLFDLIKENSLVAEEGLAVSLLYYKYCHDGVTDEYMKWFEDLPTDLNTGLYFTQDEIDQLKGSPAFIHVMTLKQESEELYERLKETIFKNKIFSKCTANWERFKWATSIVSSRGIYTEIPLHHQIPKENEQGQEEEVQQKFTIVLVPFIDYFNHDNDAQATYEFDHLSNSIRVSTITPIKANDQIFLNYGHQDCSSDRLIDYGFIDSKPTCVNVLFEELLELIPDNDKDLITKTNILEQAFEMNQRLKLFGASMTEELLKVSKYLAPSHKLLEFIKSLVDLKLDHYPTTLDQDQSIVNDKQTFSTLSYRTQLAIRMRLQEKQELKEIRSLLQTRIDQSKNQSSPKDSNPSSSSKVKDEL